MWNPAANPPPPRTESGKAGVQAHHEHQLLQPLLPLLNDHLDQLAHGVDGPGLALLWPPMPTNQRVPTPGEAFTGQANRDGPKRKLSGVAHSRGCNFRGGGCMWVNSKSS